MVYPRVDKGDRRGVVRLTIQETARQLGVSEGAVRKRVNRGTLRSEKEEDGRVYVYLDERDRRGVDDGQDEGVEPNSNALISQLKDEVAYLRDENRRKDEIIMQQAMTMRQLTAAPPQEAAETAPRRSRRSRRVRSPGPLRKGHRRARSNLGGGGGSVAEFVCACEERFRSVCEGLEFYGEYEDKRYCVLHFPGEEKEAAFKDALESKLAQKDYDFSGTVFPEGTSNFEGREFDADANFDETTFIGKANFNGAQFSGDWTSFERTKFSGELTDFSRAQFSSERTSFLQPPNHLRHHGRRGCAPS